MKVLPGESAPEGRLHSESLGTQLTAKGRMSAEKGKKKEAPGGRLHSGSLGTQATAKGRMGNEKEKRKCPKGSAAFRIARNTGYCQGADDSYIGLHRVSVNPFPQACPSRITHLDWLSCVAGETSGVAGVGWRDDTGVT